MVAEVELDKGAAAIIDAMQGERLAVLAGAGISMAPPSECPSWLEFVDLVMKAGAKAYPSPLAQASIERWNPKAVKTEAVCQLLHANHGTTVLDALNLLVQGRPNRDHHALAKLAREDRLQTVLTMNFDVYLEQALHFAGVSFATEVGAPSRGAARKLARSLTVFKPHGSIVDAWSIAMTMRQVGRAVDPRLRDVVATTFRRYPLLVVGYSASDDDLFPLLVAEAAAARRVFWAVWREVPRNVSSFAKRSPNCTIVHCHGRSILEAVSSGAQRGSPRPDVQTPGRLGILRSARDDKRLLPWACGLPAEAWTNFFADLLLLSTPTADDARLIAAHATAILREEHDDLVMLRARRTRGLAHAVLGDVSRARSEIAEVLSGYEALSRQRDYMELFAAAVELDPEPGDDAFSIPSRYADQSYDPYFVGLYLYAAGIASRRAVAKREFLLASAGFLRRAGDLITLRKCLLRIAAFADEQNDPALAAMSRRQTEVIAGTQSVVDDELPDGRNPVLDVCEVAARRWSQQVLRIFLGCSSAISAVLSFIAVLITGKWWQYPLWFLSGLAVSVGGRLLGARHLRSHSSIDRS